jgi:sugar phosphate isomerase/epimerase
MEAVSDLFKCLDGVILYSIIDSPAVMRLGLSAFRDKAENYLDFGAQHIEIATWIPQNTVESLSRHRLRELKAAGQDRGITWSFHAPFTLNIADPIDIARKGTLDYLMQLADIAYDLEAESITLHPGSRYAFSYRPYTKEEAMENAIDTINRFAGSTGLVIAIENTSRSDGSQRLQSLGDNIPDLVRILESTPDNVMFCFDPGHANIGGDPLDYLDAFLDRTHTVHVHDNYGYRDPHDPLFQGDIPWTSIIMRLGSSGFDGAYVSEIVGQPFSDYRETMERLARKRVPLAER